MHRLVEQTTYEKRLAAIAARANKICKAESEPDSMYGTTCRNCGEEYFFAENAESSDSDEDEDEDED